MRLPLIIASILCTRVYSTVSHATPPEKKVSSRKLGLNIQVKGDGWGKAARANIETVLYAVADELMSQLSRKPSVPIVVTHTRRNPVVLYDRGPNGEYLVQLHASDENWHLYVYEFAHELCHILSNYEEYSGEDNARYNQWFEETLCETASLFTLKKLAASWKASPPAPEWSAQAGRLQAFYDLLIDEGHRRLPAHSPLAVWLGENEEALRHNPYLRQKNEVVANLLLPLFERDPENWATLSYLNLDPADARSNLRDYLHRWYGNAPTAHKAFIADILTLFWWRERNTPASPPNAGDPQQLAAAGPSPRPEIAPPTRKQ